MAIQDETTRKLLNTSTHENFKRAFKKRWPGSEGITIDVDQETQIIKISGYNGYRNGSWEITNKTESESQDEHKNVVYFEKAFSERRGINDIMFNLKPEDL